MLARTLARANSCARVGWPGLNCSLATAPFAALPGLLSVMTNAVPAHEAARGSATLELPLRVDKPWGHEIWYAHTTQYAGKIIVVEAGHRLSLQYHEAKDETSYLLSGKLRLWQGDSAESLVEREISPGEAWRNTTGVVHTIEAIETATVLEVSTPELEDVVRLDDRYGREGTSAP
jgi:quercetin dioxygenase-like cupin family protein